MISIEKANSFDIPELKELLRQLFDIERDFEFDETLQSNGLQRIINFKNNRCVIFVARINNKVVGMCSGQLVVSTAAGGDSVWVEDMVVHQRYRKNGIGTALISKVEEWANENKAKRIQLVTDNNNVDAFAFYYEFNYKSTQLSVLNKKIK